MDKKVEELVERRANAIGFHLLDTGVYDHAKDVVKIARELAVIALDESDLALIDKADTVSLPDVGLTWKTYYHGIPIEHLKEVIHD